MAHPTAFRARKESMQTSQSPRLTAMTVLLDLTPQRKVIPFLIVSVIEDTMVLMGRPANSASRESTSSSLDPPTAVLVGRVITALCMEQAVRASSLRAAWTGGQHDPNVRPKAATWL